ncbi:tyrosine-type recombinase/integrase [Candidatus Contubernalis alkaliaceticus]|uniref:tyrosine-type recombinase/integrase n=1 Tax=Candidatus Contubernalis alkaliaceticus TaxID=338645 RepID=UPI001F4C3344|nr:tyrosine-type recombinase/integrase [Candidatus Contubernalis alkalaceticus]UNC92812.1 tyrosine-type recombinase/integrase [Candidatus Contubernalis alkalaceticus]
MELLLKEHVSRVLQLQSDAGYKDSTISFYRIAYNRLEALAEQMGIDRFNEKLARAFLKDRIDRRTGTICKSRCHLQNIAVRRLREYADTGQINWKNNMHHKQIRKTPDSLSFQLLSRAYLSILSDEGKKQNTVNGYRNVSTSFLQFCERQSISDLSTLKPTVVVNFFKELSQTWSALSMRTAAPALRSFLDFVNAPIEAVQAIPLNCPRKTVIPQVLTEDQEDRLWNTLCANETSARDRALVMLLFVTGLRPVDVVNLMLEDLNWKKEVIHLVQRKTGRPLMLPIAPSVGNAIVEYVTTHRPPSPYRNVFLKTMAPYTPLKDHAACYAIIKSVFHRAGIKRTDPSGGARLFRCGTASNLLKAGVSFNHIAACLGHSDHDSAHAYLSVDRHRMLQCILPLPQKGEAGEGHA